METKYLLTTLKDDLEKNNNNNNEKEKEIVQLSLKIKDRIQKNFQVQLWPVMDLW